MKEKWTTTRAGVGTVSSRPISKEIQDKMPPPGSKPFTQKSVFEVFKEELGSIKKLRA